ncbi:MAG: hypothetical protein JO250_09690, partial [Armatimonadetes bacterium]|nr:hypothetical protein [Armatimonadota bacterium]
MRIRVMAAASAGAALLSSLAGAAARAQGLHVIRPAHNAIVRETVAFRVPPSEAPPGGYVAISIDDKFVTAKALPASPGGPIFLWDTKAGNVKDGDHRVTLAVYTGGSNSQLVGSDTIPVRVANQIAVSGREAFKLTYH